MLWQLSHYIIFDFGLFSLFSIEWGVCMILGTLAALCRSLYGSYPLKQKSRKATTVVSPVYGAQADHAATVMPLT